MTALSSDSLVFNSCSQTRTTRTPSRRKSRLITLALRTLLSIFARQYDRLPCGSQRQRLHPCQKHPSTNKAILFAANQKSGLPSTDSECNVHPEILARTKASRSRTSVERLPRERTFAIQGAPICFGQFIHLKTKNAHQMRRYSVVELYAGIARTWEAFRSWDRCKLSLLADINELALDNYTDNYPSAPHIKRNLQWMKPSEIEGITEGKVDILLGCPPCQGFIDTGKRDPDDPRNVHIDVFARFVRELLPFAVAMQSGFGKGVRRMHSDHMFGIRLWVDFYERLRKHPAMASCSTPTILSLRTILIPFILITFLVFPLLALNHADKATTQDASGEGWFVH